ncbi:hypothetical protein [Hutsoniella sourekii]
MTYLDVETLKLINQRLIEKYSPQEINGVKDKPALLMAVEQPKQEIFVV